MLRPAGFDSLRTFVQQHPDQNPEFTTQLRDSSLAVIDYVRQTLLQSDGFDRKTVFEMMDDLRDAYRSLGSTWQDGQTQNQ